MADLIALLPDHIANQIAAGEVIQRPASVVKELIENSVDAGADNIRLEVENYGKTSIRVTDNGKGMSGTDARLCWERHATSKIRKADDLFCIRTRGFRGEGLASIAAVAQVEMRTRQEGHEMGTRIVLEASEVKSQEPAMVPKGTSIAVHNLFFNIPARRNFLKSNPVELRHIHDEFIRVAIAEPEIAFTFSHNGNVVYSLPPADLRSRLLKIWEIERDEQVLEIAEQTSVSNLVLYLGTPATARKMKGDQFIFVNRRFIRDPYLFHAVMSVYNDFFKVEGYPPFAVFMEVPPDKVDVNVHPSKTEVKFEDEKAIYSFIHSLTRKALGTAGLVPPPAQEQGSFEAILLGQLQKNEPADFGSSVIGQFGKSFTRGEMPQSRLHNWDELLKTETPPPPLPAMRGEEGAERLPETKLGALTVNAAIQVAAAFIVCDTDNGMLIIDQYRAHQRILFERYQQIVESGHSSTQQLLFPRTIALPPVDMELVMALIPDFMRLGFDIQPFGTNAIIINGVPADLEKAEGKDLFMEIFNDYKQTSQLSKSKALDSLLISLATKSALNKGKRLSNSEISALIGDLGKCRNPAVSPSGLPVFTIFAGSQLAALLAKHQ